MVFNATFNNIIVISWRSVLLVEATGVSGEKTTYLPKVTDKLYYIMSYTDSIISGDICPTYYLKSKPGKYTIYTIKDIGAVMAIIIW
jgi:hypothetical protein